MMKAEHRASQSAGAGHSLAWSWAEEASGMDSSVKVFMHMGSLVFFLQENRWPLGIKNHLVLGRAPSAKNCHAALAVPWSHFSLLQKPAAGYSEKSA